MKTTYDIGIDYDDVLYPWSDTAHGLCEAAGITNGQVVSQWHMWKDYGCTEQEVWNVLAENTLNGSLYAAWPYPGVLAQLRRLRAYGHRVHIVTARGFGKHGELIQALTREQASEWNLPLDSLTFSHDKSVVPCDFFLDDGLHNYDPLDAKGVEVYLMNRPHNQVTDRPRRRVSSVKEFADLILERAVLV